MNIRAFVGGRITREFRELCARIKVNPDSIDELLFEDLKRANENFGPQTDAERVRALYEQFRERRRVKSHLAALFGIAFALVSRYLHDPNSGRGLVGRPRALTKEQEEAVM